MSIINLYNSSDIANRIKIQAKQRDIKIKDLLSICDLGINTISKMSNGTDIHSKNLAKIADCLECSLDFLMGRSNIPEINAPNRNIPTYLETSGKSNIKTIIMPFYRTPASAGTGSLLFDEIPIEYINVPKTEKTSTADFMLEVRGDSMQPKFVNGDCVLVKQTNSIYEGEIGVFILNGESYIKKMGRGELISLNSAYDPIKLTEYDDIRCAGKVIDIITME